MSGGDVLVTLAVLLLFVEAVKVVRIGRRGVVDHGLALLLFGGMLAEFVLVKQAASATFFLLLATSFFEVLGGFTLTRRSRPRNLAVEHVEHIEPAPAAVEPAPAPMEPAPKPVEPTEHTAS
jgi:hypothetical protein